MFIELTPVFEDNGSKALFNVEHISIVRSKGKRAFICYNQGPSFTTIDVKESYAEVMGAIHHAIKQDANIRRLGHEIR